MATASSSVVLRMRWELGESRRNGRSLFLGSSFVEIVDGRMELVQKLNESYILFVNGAFVVLLLIRTSVLLLLLVRAKGKCACYYCCAQCNAT